MAGPFSPSRDGGYLYSSSPPEDISLRMRVPKRIKANGDVVDDDPHDLVNGYQRWDAPDKFDMNVPDRIMLAGQDRHIGTRAPPREIVLENSVLGNALTMEDVRVNTPPRVITLEHLSFPTAADDPPSPDDQRPSPPLTRKQLIMPEDTPKTRNIIDSRIMFRETTPPVEGLTAAEEVVHLRRQVARINRRVMAIELDAIQRQQRERIIYAVGIVYVLYKVIAWMNRS